MKIEEGFPYEGNVIIDGIEYGVLKTDRTHKSSEYSHYFLFSIQKENKDKYQMDSCAISRYWEDIQFLKIKNWILIKNEYPGSDYSRVFFFINSNIHIIGSDTLSSEFNLYELEFAKYNKKIDVIKHQHSNEYEKIVRKIKIAKLMR